MTHRITVHEELRTDVELLALRRAIAAHPGGLVAPSAASTLAANGAVALDASAANTFLVTLQANATSTTVSNLTAGQEITVVFIQDATGGRTYAWPASAKFNTTAPSDTTATKRTLVKFLYDGTSLLEVTRSVAL